MKRVPFNIDELKIKYIDDVAEQYLNKIKEEAREKNLSSGFKKSVKRARVKDVQDMFLVEYKFESLDKKIEIEKFFMPDSLFIERYFRDMEEEATKTLMVNGKEVVNNLLKWGRLIIKWWLKVGRYILFTLFI